MKKPKTYLYIILCAIFLFLAIIFFLASNSKTIYKMNYQEVANIDYKVYLKNNNYYNAIYLEEDMKYIPNLINYIDIDYNYNLKTSSKFKILSTNIIDAKIIIKDNDKLLYNKDIHLTESETKKYLNDEINISKNIKVNYPEYKTIVDNLLKEYSITNDIYSFLKIELSIVNDYDIMEIPNLDIDKKSMVLVIPLSNNTIEIEKEYNNIKNYQEIKYALSKDINNYILLGISIIFFLITIVIFIILFISIKNNNFYKRQYKKVLNKILKKYNKNIVNVKDIPDMRGFDVYDVVSIEELVDTSKIFNRPIMHLEIEKDRVNLFFVEDNNEIYQYLMRTKK